jgi:hypothetical protein
MLTQDFTIPLFEIYVKAKSLTIGKYPAMEDGGMRTKKKCRCKWFSGENKLYPKPPHPAPKLASPPATAQPQTQQRMGGLKK